MRNSIRNLNKGAGSPHPLLLTVFILTLPYIPSGASAEVNLFTPEMQKIKQTFDTETAQHGVSRTNAVAQFLDRQIETYDQQLAAHKRTGNVTKMGIARTASRALAQMKEGLAAEKLIAMPARVRRELKPEFAVIERELKALQGTHSATASAARKVMFDQFVEACRAQDPALPEPSDLEAAFNRLLATKAPTVAEGQPGDGTATAPVDDVPETPTVLSTSGASMEWAGIGFLQVEANAMDLMEIKIAGVREPSESTGKHMVNQEPYTIRYQPIRIFEPVETAHFQIRSVPGKLPLEVFEWPDAKNQWTFSFRVRPSEEIPSQHVVELMAGYEGVSSLAMLETSQTDTGDGVEPVAKPQETNDVKLTIGSAPDGAAVFLNGRRARIDKRRAVTPCSLTVRAGTYDIVLRKYAFKDAFIKQLEIRKDTTIQRELAMNEKIVDESISVSAAQSWRNSRIRVTKGETFSMIVKGHWGCGSDGELVDAAGYPNDRKFFKYYANAKEHPRQITGANFGALLMRIGSSGPMHKVGLSLRGRARASGFLYFDINESPLPSHRADNLGRLTILFRRSDAARRR